MTQEDVAILISRHLATTPFQAIPGDVLEITKRSILDTIGVMLGASGVAPACRKVASLLADAGGKAESSVFGFGNRLPAGAAAFANGAMTKTLDYDDVVGEAFVHPTAVTLPAALAMAQKLGGISGKDFLAAMTLGMDLAIRLGLSVTRSSRGFKYDWHPTPLFGAFSSTAAAGRLLRLDADEMADALGIAFLQAAGSLQMVYSEGADIGLLANGFPARTGILSAMMARNGITGIKDCLESKAGFFANYFQGGYDRTFLTDGLGEKFALPMIGYKPWPTCRRAHPYIDAALQIVAANSIRPEDVTEVKVSYGDAFTKNLCTPLDARRSPKTCFFANTSLPFCVAVAIAKRRATVSDFQPAALQDPLVLQMASKVIPEYDSELDTRLSGGIPGGKVTITTRSGQSFSRKVDIPYGHFRNPVSRETLIEKFKDCASYSARPISQERVDHFIQMALNLEDVGDIEELIRCLG